MIRELEVKHFALLENARVRFERGLNVFTGETGAGKSLVVDALLFLVGEGNSSGGDVQGIFTPSQETLDLLAEQGFEIEEEFFISRESRPGGKTVSRINGTFVPIGKIKAIAPFLVEIHSQHSHHSLFEPRTHLDLLDSFAGAETVALREAFCKEWKAWRSLCKESAELEELQSKREREMDLCRYELNEIEKANLQRGEELLLREEKERLSQVDKLQQIFSELSGLLEKVNIQKIVSHLEKLSPFEQKLSPWATRLQEWDYEWLEMKEILNSCRENFLPDPARLESIVDRLDVIFRLKKKYGDDILDYARRRKEELQSLESVSEKLEELKKKLKNAEENLRGISPRLSLLRKEKAEKLKGAVEREFALLSFPHGKFQVSVEQLENWNNTGKDRAEFLVRLNPGYPFMPLREAASGGELSRIMLALRAILASDPVETFVFDEIDAGIGGETAFHVAERLQLLGKSKQVLCVTHLHQVASCADRHFFVEKFTDNGKTLASVKLLSEDERIDELARMMGGARATDALIRHARELRNASQGKKISPP